MKNHLQILAGLTGFAILLRILSFFPSVINHDESTYLVIAETLLNGYTYFVDYVDTKPIGIFLIIAGFLKIVGKSIFLFRFFVAIVLSLTAFGLYLIQKTLLQPERVALASAAIYLILNSLFTFYGVSPNTETFFNLFTIFGLFLILRKNGKGEYLLAGILLGIAFMIKYVVAFDILAFGIFLLREPFLRRETVSRFLGNTFLLITGFVLIPLMILWYYKSIANLDTWWFHSFVVPGRYPKLHDWQDFLIFPLDFFLRFLPVSACFFWVLWRGKLSSDFRVLAFLWSGLTLLSIMLPGNAYGHYFIQFMLPFSLVAGIAWGTSAEELPKWLRWIRHRRIMNKVLIVLVALNFVFQYSDYLRKPDYPRIISKYLKPRLNAEDRIYTGNADQILYFLLRKEVPNTYVHPSLFWEQKHLDAMEIDVIGEVNKIKSAKPKYVLFKDGYPDDRFDTWIENAYHLDTTFRDGRIALYERNK